ncbi:MAG TPA: Sir2 family NAD-dependent protein deacetylase [Thermoanaerobaculia bacterium]|nr:Sir2 family NAD-dependent protein deacetylase [Thermoanaerobaculia bacterium]
MGAELDRLTLALDSAAAQGVVVITGAGVSLASGIPTFRGTDPGAVWARDVTELGTLAYFRRDPLGSWRWYLERFSQVLRARPNPAHHALAALERWHAGGGGELLLVSQNIDTLHEAAGSQRLVKVHGSVDRVRCCRDGCTLGAPAGSLARDQAGLERFAAAPLAENLPRCPRCDSLLRPHVLWFDEYYQGHDDYQIERVLAAADAAALLLFVGTSFSVGVTDLLLRAAWRRRTPVLAIDPVAASSHPPGVELLCAAAEGLLPAAVQCLAGR